MTDFRKKLRRELNVLFDQGHTAQGPILYTKEQVVEIAEEKIITAIRESMLLPSTIIAAHKGVPPPCQIERVITNALNEVLAD